MVAVLPIIILISVFIAIAVLKDKIIPALFEIAVDFIITIVFLGIAGIWVKIPEAWVIVLLFVGVGILFFTHVARNKEAG